MVALVAAASVALLLAAAKTHGRHVRLERELAGVMEIEDFRTAYEHPVVGPLWARDRRRYWTIAPVAAIALGALAWAADGWALALVAAALWGPTVAFLVCGAWSHTTWTTDVRAKADVDRAWAEDARRGTRIWWAVTVGAAGAVVLVAVFT